MARAAQYLRDKRLCAARSLPTGAPSPLQRPVMSGNQAMLRRMAHRTPQTVKSQKLPSDGASSPDAKSSSAQTSAAKSVNVWGLQIDRTMCGCKDTIRNDIAWANTAAATYATCDVPSNKTGDDVEKCFEAAHPDSKVNAGTDASGKMTLPPESKDPCQKIANKATFVHETMHARHTDDIARAQGAAFFAAWQKLAGDPDRVDKLKATFPKEVDAFLKQWHEGSDWAKDEVHSYTWERRFEEDALAALNKIC